MITQSGSSYSISALMGTLSAPAFYSYGAPAASSANTGLEMSNTLILFLYEDINTGIISLFLIADIANDGSGGTMQFEASCLPPTAFVSVQDDAGEFSGSPPLITGNWSWGACCTDGGVIENIGCNNTINLDLLVSSGLSSIVWLTGDIANPTQIPLSMTGEAITINCGGGVCCPQGFDTDIVIVDATCDDSPNGSISLLPQDGVPPYMFNWSNGDITQNVNGLLPGSYTVTITDAQGCQEELNLMVDVSPGDPPAAPASIALCSPDPEVEFDLTTVENIINLGSGDNVLWFLNPDLTGSITNPSAFLSGSTIVYAAVDNGSCLSDAVPVELTLIPSPVAEPAMAHLCEEQGGMATFDLTQLNNTVSGGAGTVLWYTDPGLTDEINSPDAFTTASTIVYAVVFDGTCYSLPAEVELMVDLLPEGNPASMSLCGDENDEAVFDLTLLESAISGGNGSVDWFLEMDLSDPITNENAFQTTTITVYAAVFDGICYSEPIPVDLIVEPTPVGNPLSIDGCDDGSGMSLFALDDYEMQISGGAGGINWFLDMELLEPIPNPTAFYTETTIVYAQVDNGICLSDPVPVNLNVIISPVGIPGLLETCADSSGQGVFNLTALDNVVSAGQGPVTWFEDNQGDIMIQTPTAYTNGGGFVYAQIQNGNCVSGFTPVELIIINSVSATPTQYAACDEGGNLAIFDLTDVDLAVSGGSGQVSWYVDSLAMNPILQPDSFPSSDTIVYARVTAGTCVSGIVPVDLQILATPAAAPLNLSFCGDSLGLYPVNLTGYDTMIGGSQAMVTWFMNSALTDTINTPPNFITGDTLLYATVSDGVCVSLPARVDITVINALSANSSSIFLCLYPGDSVEWDLVTLNPQVHHGTGQVNWLTDPAGVNSIANVNAFVLYQDSTVYAQVQDSGCVSPIVPVTFDVNAIPVTTSVTLLKCGDTNGQAVFDLTATAPLVSNNTGTVMWYLDPLQAFPIATPGAFISGDSLVYALVTNGPCMAPVVPVVLDVTDSLIANVQVIQACVLDQDSAFIDLTQFDLAVSGGSGAVTWFSDAGAMDTIQNASSYFTGNSTVFALVAADGCISNLASIPIEIETSSLPVPSCVFSSIDSVGIVWLPVSDEYSVIYSLNGLPIGSPTLTPGTSFGVGGLGQGDTIIISVSALYDSICTLPLTNSVTCITDVCPPVSIQFPGLASMYCRDADFVVVHPNPPGGILSGPGVSGDTLYLHQVAGNQVTLHYALTDASTHCVYDDFMDVAISDPLSAPILNCQASGLDSVSFAWTGGSQPYGYLYSINSGPAITPGSSNTQALTINGLAEGDSVTLSIWSIGPSPCGNSDTISVTCRTRICPSAILDILDPQVFCSDTLPFQLQGNWTGVLGNPAITWSGDAVIDPGGIVDPVLAVNGSNDVTLRLEADGCIYTKTESFFVEDVPIDTAVLSCLAEDYHSVVVTWMPVPGATGYTVTCSSGSGQQDHFSYTVNQLPDNTKVNITVIAYGADGCTPSAATIECQTLRLIPVLYFVPNVFSPNHDDVNDVFYIQANSEVLKVNALRLFDRWGNVVFENFNFLPNDSSEGWDGSFQGKEMNPAVYTYVAELETSRGAEVVYGDVTLMH